MLFVRVKMAPISDTQKNPGKKRVTLRKTSQNALCVSAALPVDGAKVVKPAARHKSARGSVGTCHHPRGAQRNGMHLKIEILDYFSGIENVVLLFSNAVNVHSKSLI